MPEFRIVPRTEIGLTPEVYNNDGVTLRPPLSQERWLTVHYTGVDVAWGDPGDTPAEIRSIQRYAQGAGKSNEYNYVIGQDNDDLIYEYAGHFQAAHSAGENSQSVGVLMLNGTREPLTDKQVRKFRWLRQLLVFDGTLKPNHEVTPHKEMPGAATACPGDLILARWSDLLAPYTEIPAPPPPPLPAYDGLLYPVTDALKPVSWWEVWRRTHESPPTTERVQSLIDANGGNETLRVGDLLRIPGKVFGS